MFSCFWYNYWAFSGELAQLGERLAGSQKVTGSSPVFSTILFCEPRGSHFSFCRPALCRARKKGITRVRQARPVNAKKRA